jgi:hypothetical protein
MKMTAPVTARQGSPKPMTAFGSPTIAGRKWRKLRQGPHSVFDQSPDEKPVDAAAKRIRVQRVKSAGIGAGIDRLEMLQHVNLHGQPFDSGRRRAGNRVF